MITTTDIANILFEVCDAFGMPVYQGGNVPTGHIGTDGRVVIHTKEQTSESTWKKGFVEVNLFAADTPKGNADLIKLNALERMAYTVLQKTGQYDGTTYRFSVASTTIESNEELKAHYVNAKVLFKAMNTIEY